MIVKFEAKSQRVKGLIFHPYRPWILSSLHNGVIQLWDYRIGTMIDKFEGHEGPVRGIDFHKTQPLIVSGGDDYNIKAHLDYIRTVQFHNELPWIISSSDDQTIRIWNWQNRSLVTIMTGHSHYVMCAEFHPSKDLIVSCSLDQTIRIWDYSSIRKKMNKGGSDSKQSKPDVYGYQVEILAVLDGHDRGVNWVSFHPTQNLIVSAADDRKVKLWKYTESKAWEHDSLYGHSSNVSSCRFHPKLNIIVSNSEDKTTRIWCMEKRCEIEKYKRDGDRFWVITVHPENFFFASGCDSGFFVFSLVKERIPFQMINPQNIIYAYKKNLRMYNLNQKQEQVLKNLEENVDNTHITDNIIDLQYNSYDSVKPTILIAVQDKDKGVKRWTLLQYEGSDIKSQKETVKQFYSWGACFISKNKIARIKEEGKELEIYNLELNQASQSLPGLEKCQKLFQGPLGKLLLMDEEQLIQYDINAKKIISQTPLAGDLATLKSAIWSKNHSFVALICKKSILIYTKSMSRVCQFNEKFNIKSLIWTKENAILYTTINHTKFGLLNGENGILKCNDQKVRIVQFENDELMVMDSNSVVTNIKLECEEFQLKLALYEKNIEKTKFYMQSGKQIGNSTIAYLYKKNYSSLAMKLVEDKRAKFSLAIDCGNLEIAYKTCQEEKDKELYKKLGEEALRQGNYQLLEKAYQFNKNFDKLSFLQVILGNQEKLEKLLNIANDRGDNMSRFHNSLYLGDVQERIRILAEIGQLNLAYMTAVVHGCEELVNPLRDSIENPELLLKQIRQLHSTALVPPKPLIKDLNLSPQAKRNWPHNSIADETSIMISKDQEKIEEIKEQEQNNDLIIDNDQYDKPQPKLDENQTQIKTNFSTVINQQVTEQEDQQDLGEWGIEELEIPDNNQAAQSQQQSESHQNQNSGQNKNIEGENPVFKAAFSSQHISDQTAIGFFENAFSLMKKQLGIVYYKPLEKQMLSIYATCFTNQSNIPFIRHSFNFIQSGNNHRPFVSKVLGQVSTDLKNAYTFTLHGKFQEAVHLFRQILQTIPFLILQQNEDKEIQSLIRICLEYIVALESELTKKQFPNKSLEFTSYMALCNIQPQHRVLALRSAMSLHYKNSNFIYSSYFAKKLIRIIESNQNAAKPDVLQNAKKILTACEQNGSNQVKINIEEAWLYDEEWVFNLDTLNFSVIKGESVKCPFCTAKYEKQNDGKICFVCQVAKIGVEVLGLKK